MSRLWSLITSTVLDSEEEMPGDDVSDSIGDDDLGDDVADAVVQNADEAGATGASPDPTAASGNVEKGVGDVARKDGDIGTTGGERKTTCKGIGLFLYFRSCSRKNITQDVVAASSFLYGRFLFFHRQLLLSHFSW